MEVKIDLGAGESRLPEVGDLWIHRDAPVVVKLRIADADGHKLIPGADADACFSLILDTYVVVWHRRHLSKDIIVLKWRDGIPTLVPKG